ncbi:MAG: Ldh family oxidoreductase [Pseudomonadota bacterium]
MPIVAADRLRHLAEDTLRAAGASHAVAVTVATHLVECNMRGVDSHGVNRIPSYLELIASGFIDAHAEPVLHGQEGNVLRVNGAGGFGIAAMELAAEQLPATVSGSGIAAAAITNCGHTGRIGAYADSLAEHGMVAIILGGGGHQEWPAVAPFGGARGLLGTNPYAFAMPGGQHGNVVVDFATSATAQGKLAVARAEGKAAPPGHILDRDGQPTSDVDAFYAGGAILPAAGPKGYGMALIAELVGYALLSNPLEYNWLMIGIDIAHVRPGGGYDRDAADILAKVKAVPGMPGVDEVMIPGEPERRLRAERRKAGVPVADGVWDGIAKAAEGVGIHADAYLT